MRWDSVKLVKTALNAKGMDRRVCVRHVKKGKTMLKLLEEDINLFVHMNSEMWKQQKVCQFMVDGILQHQIKNKNWIDYILRSIKHGPTLDNYKKVIMDHLRGAPHVN